MSSSLKAAIIAGAIGGICFISAAPALAQAQRPPEDSILAWAPKPAEATPWVAPHKPHWKLADVLAKHKGEKNWSETIVNDKDFTAKYISMQPGEKTKKMLYADSRIFWVVQDGQIRFSIEGQEPFIATSGFLVQVPYRTPFSMETIGKKPSLRFEVTQSGVLPFYTADETPTPVTGTNYVKVAYRGHGEYDDVNKPYLDFKGDIAAGGKPRGPFVKDDKTFANIIRGEGMPLPPPTNLGHFHTDYNEFWFIMEGQIDYLIEGQEVFSAHEGDIVLAPQGRFHRASWGGEGMATRLAINPRPAGMHNYEPPH
ncbi:MAG: cupin domain-containing protein [Amphiplicatus sp.]